MHRSSILFEVTYTWSNEVTATSAILPLPFTIAQRVHVMPYATQNLNQNWGTTTKIKRTSSLFAFFSHSFLFFSRARACTLHLIVYRVNYPFRTVHNIHVFTCTILALSLSASIHLFCRFYLFFCLSTVINYATYTSCLSLNDLNTRSICNTSEFNMNWKRTNNAPEKIKQKQCRQLLRWRIVVLAVALTLAQHKQ